MGVSDLPEYGAARAKYDADKRAAEQSGDEMALERVNLGWEREMLNMERKANEVESHANALGAARDAAKAELGDNYPSEVFESITDPDKVKSVAANLKEKLAAVTTPPQGQGDWGGGAPPTGEPGGQAREEVPYEQFVGDNLANARKGFQRDKVAHADRVLDAVINEKIAHVMPGLKEGE